MHRQRTDSTTQNPQETHIQASTDHMNIDKFAFGLQETIDDMTTHGQLITFHMESLPWCSTLSAATGINKKMSMSLLPVDFQPSPYSVFCGRGKGYYNACGNRRLRVTVMSFMPQYLDAEGVPTERSRIISRVKNIIKECCPVGAFIKYEKGRYYELSDKAAREKCSALFRDCVQAQNKRKQSKKQVKESTRSVLGSAYVSQLSGETSRRPSMESNSCSGSSLGSFYDVETEQPVSLKDSEVPEAKMAVTLKGLSEFLGHT
jgi:hypothetical protein